MEKKREREEEEEERVDKKEPTDSSHEFVKLRGFQFHRCRGSVCHGANVTRHCFGLFLSFLLMTTKKKKLEKRDGKEKARVFCCVQF